MLDIAAAVGGRHFFRAERLCELGSCWTLWRVEPNATRVSLRPCSANVVYPSGCCALDQAISLAAPAWYRRKPGGQDRGGECEMRAGWATPRTHSVVLMKSTRELGRIRAVPLLKVICWSNIQRADCGRRMKDCALRGGHEL